MDRRKAEAHNQLRTLQQESQVTCDLLNRLIHMCSKHVNDIEKLDSKGFRMNSKYFLAVLQFQSASIQKIIEWNMDLEEFLTEKGPADLENFTVINTNGSPSTSSLCDSEANSVSPTHFIAHKPSAAQTVTKNKVNVGVDSRPERIHTDEANVAAETSNIDQINTSTEIPTMDVTPIQNNRVTEANKLLYLNNSNVITEAADEKETKKNKIDVEVDSNPERIRIDKANVKAETFSTNKINVSTEISTSMEIPTTDVLEANKLSDLNNSDEITEAANASESTLVGETSIADTKDFQMPASILNESISSSDYFYSLSSHNSGKSPVEMYDSSSYYTEFSSDAGVEEPFQFPRQIQKETTKQCTASNISEKLKSLPTMSMQDRFFKSLSTVPMPDLSLRPASEHQKKCETLNYTNSKQVDIPLSNHMCSENINLTTGRDRIVTESDVKNKIKVKGLQQYKNPVDLVGIEDRVAPKVGDICMIGYAISPSEIYIQVADENIDSIDVLPVQLAELYENTSFSFASKTDAMKKLGNFCSYSCEGGWCRVEVLDWLLTAQDAGDNVVIQAVDYGSKNEVSYKELRPLQSELRNIPKMAQLCHLGYLYPPGSTKHRRLNDWPFEATEGFFEVLGDLDSTMFKIVHVYYCEQRNSYEIELIKLDEENEESTIGQLLLDSGLAVQIIDDDSELLRNDMKNQILRAQGLNGISPDMPEEDKWEKYFQRNLGDEPQNLNEAVIGYDPRDEAETCKNLRKDGTCYKGKACKWRHVPLTDGFTRDREPVYDSAFEKADLPRTGDEVFMTISHIVDIQSFYAQIRRDSHILGYPRSPLKSLVNTMNNPSVVKGYEKLKRPPACSEIVIAKHWNGFWYRAQVRDVQIPEEGNNVIVEVYIVDFGDTLEVPMSDLRAIISDFLFLSFQAVECRLYNVKHKDSLDPAEEKIHFEERYLGQTFKAKIMGVPGHLEVLLENDRGEDIGLKLIEDGFGELNTEHHFPADESILID